MPAPFSTEMEEEWMGSGKGQNKGSGRGQEEKREEKLLSVCKLNEKI